jgi:HEAT repeat protein
MCKSLRIGFVLVFIVLAMLCMSNLGQENTKDVNSWIKDFRDQNNSVRMDAVRSLDNVSDSYSVDLLIQALNDSSIGAYAAMALIEIGKPAVGPLIQALEENDYQVRWWAAKVLGHITDSSAVEPLIQALDDDDPGVRCSAAMSLGTIGDKMAVEPLIQALKDGDSCTRGNAASALGKFRDARAMEPLNQALEDNDSQVRSAAAWALKRINASSTSMPEPAESQMNSSIKESQQVLEKAANAIESGDKARFMETMSNDTLRKVSGDPDLSMPQAAKIVEGLRGAKAVDQRVNMVVYEMTIDASTYSFFTVKEDGAWKISGL